MLYSACASAKHASWERDGHNNAPGSEPERRGLAEPRFSDTESGDMPSLAFTAPFSRGTPRGVVPTRDFHQEIRDIAGIFLVGRCPTAPPAQLHSVLRGGAFPRMAAAAHKAFRDYRRVVASVRRATDTAGPVASKQTNKCDLLRFLTDNCNGIREHVSISQVHKNHAKVKLKPAL